MKKKNTDLEKKIHPCRIVHQNFDFIHIFFFTGKKILSSRMDNPWNNVDNQLGDIGYLLGILLSI